MICWNTWFCFLYKNTYTQTHPSNWSVVLIVFVHFTLAFLSFFLFLWNLSLYDIFRRCLSVSGDSTFLITITNELDYMIIIQFHSHSHYLIPAVKSSQFIFNEFGETQKNWLTYNWMMKRKKWDALTFYLWVVRATELKVAIKLVLDSSIRQRLISSLAVYTQCKGVTDVLSYFDICNSKRVTQRESIDTFATE